MSKKTSSLQGIVRPPVGWSYSNCSSAWFNNSWNDGWFKYDIGITNRFISSPTYTARYPFGTSTTFEDDVLLIIPGKRKPIFVCVVKKKIGLEKRKTCLNIENWSFWISNVLDCEWFCVGPKCLMPWIYIWKDM